MEMVLKTAAIEAGKVLLRHFNQSNHKIDFKTSHQDFYTQADIQSQMVIKSTIMNEAKKVGIKPEDIGFIGEENLHEASQKHLFIIDPLDGTTNFESGLDYFAVSVAYCLNGEIVEGIIYRPTTRDTYYVKKNGGAYKNKVRLSISAIPDLKSCLLDGIISSRNDVYPRMFESFKSIFPHVKGFRSLFCMTLSDCYLAENIFNLTINGNTFIWDIAVAKMLVEESGGEVFDFKGNPVKIDITYPKKAYNVIACHPELKNQVLKYFK